MPKLAQNFNIRKKDALLFDTVRLKVRPVPIHSEILNQYNPKSVSFLNKETGALNTKYEIYDEQLPYIEYFESSQTLSIQVSIPKFLFGNNVTMIKEPDKPVFFDKLQERLRNLFAVEIANSDWIISRCDLCWNFPVGNKAGDYIQLFGKQDVAFKNTTTHNQNQTVEYWNGSSRFKFYDKHKQTVDAKEPKEIIEKSKGLLRLEINASDYDMKKFSPKRKAVELLNKPFFDFMMARVLKNLDYPAAAVNELSIAWLTENKKDIAQIETLLGFQKLRGMFDDSTLKQLYTEGTFRNRKKLAREIQFPQQTSLNPLQIDFEYLA